MAASACAALLLALVLAACGRAATRTRVLGLQRQEERPADAGLRSDLRHGHPQRRGLVLVGGQEGRAGGRPGGGRQAHLEPVQQRPAEGGAADRRRGLPEGRRPRRVRAERRRHPRLAAEGQGGGHPDHHAQLRRETDSKSLGAITHVGQDESVAGRAAGAALQVRGRQEGAVHRPRAEQHRPPAALRRRQAGFRRHGDQPAGQGHGRPRHHPDRDQVQAAGRQVLRRR